MTGLQIALAYNVGVYGYNPGGSEKSRRHKQTLPDFAGGSTEQIIVGNGSSYITMVLKACILIENMYGR